MAIFTIRVPGKLGLLAGHSDSFLFARAIGNMAGREAAENALFIEQARVQVSLDSIGDAAISTNISGNVTYLNPVAEKTMGWAKEDAFGRPFVEKFNIIDGTTRKTARIP